MKRILYIILFLSISYNVLMLSRLGYDYCKQKQRFSEWRLIEKVTLKDGYQELVQQLKEKYPEALKKDYLCISFVGDPMTEEDRESWYDFMDSAQIRLSKINSFNRLKSLDSI